MKIVIMRHGEATHRAPSDFDRELTENGIDQNRHNLQLVKEQLQDIQLFLSSPLVRAQQTAKIAKEELGYDGKIETVDWITPDVSPAEAIIKLSEYTQQSVMLFSHQPFASAFVDLLCGEELGTTYMRTSSIAAVEADPVAADFATMLWQQL